MKRGKPRRKAPMRACGQRWPSAEAALRSKRFLDNPRLLLEECADRECKGWHLRHPGRPGGGLKAAAGTGSGDPSPETRAMTYARDLGWCVRCGIAVKNIPHSCHHRLLRAQGGTHDTWNLLTLCGSGTTGCHGYVHGHPAESYASGWLVREGHNPLATPVWRALPAGPAWQWPTEDCDWADEDPQEVAA